ncbi:MAG: tetratricopeptide repeat-containing sensor histidine kinase [Bacteroidota bacterium]
MKGSIVYLVFCVGALITFHSHAQEKYDSATLADLSEKAFEFYLNSPDSSIGMAKRNLKVAIENQDVYSEGYNYFILTKAYWVKANYRLSTEYGFKAVKVFENSSYTKEWARCMVALARTLVELGNYNKAKALILQSLQLGKDHNNPAIQAEAFREYSFLWVEVHQLDSALYYADRGIMLYQQLGDSLNLGILYSRKGRIYFELKNFNQSRTLTYRGMYLDTLVGNRRGLAVSYFQAAQNEYALKNRDSAIQLLKNSISISSKIGNLSSLIRSHDLLATIYLDLKKPDLAARELMQVSQYKDSLYNSEKSGQIQEMQSLYELEGKERTIAILGAENALRQQQVKNQRLFVAILSGGVVLLMAVVFLLIRLRRIQNQTNSDLAAKNAAIEQQKEEMQVQAENLNQLNKLKAKLFSVISHDLRGPIANLQALLDLFTKKLMTADEFIQVSDKLKTNLNITQRTLENLLNWSLSQMDGIKTQQKKMEISVAIDEACRLMEEFADRKSVSLQRHGDDSINVWADPNQVQLVLRNLIHNAIKFSESHTPIHIIANRENGVCKIIVKDTGIGMTREEIDMIVGSKEHFTKMGTQQEKGTGLGLFLCKEFITRNGGSFDIKSEKGEGTEVSFTLVIAS